MSRKQSTRTAICILLVACMLSLAGVVAQAETLRRYHTAQYFDSGYSAYASAVETQAGTLYVHVYLQYAAENTAPAGISSYAVSVNGADAGTLSALNSGDTPVSFVGTVEIGGEIESLNLTPVYAAGGAKADEVVALALPAKADALVGTHAAVNNPNPEDRLNLRTGPDSKAESLRHYYNGVSVLILNELPNDWVAVSIGDSGGMARGYMKKDFLALGDAAAQVTPMMPTHEAIVASWTLYSLPDEGSAAVGTYEAGQAFTLLGESSSWWHIQVGEVTGFVRAGVLVTPEAEETPETPDPTEAVEIALATPTPVPQATATTSPAATDAPTGQHYEQSEHVARGYEVQASVTETEEENQFLVTITVMMSDEYAVDDEILLYTLYVNGERQAGVLPDADAEVAEGTLAFRAETEIAVPITALRLVPQWSRGGELEEGAVSFDIPVE